MNAPTPETQITNNAPNYGAQGIFYGPVTIFSGNYATLDELYIRPDAVFQRVRIDEFVGREWLTAKVDDFLSQNESGAFILVSEAGVGKTTFLARLVLERRYLHLFAEQVPGDANLSQALLSLSAQIVARYQLEYYTHSDTLPAIANTPSFLERLLRLAVGKLAENEKIIIVCDALDEAGTASNGNVFGLPTVLPKGVYLILSQRPVEVRLNFKEFAPHIERLDAASIENQQDIWDYLTAAACRPAISRQLQDHNYGANDFVHALTERSRGVWIYLYYVIREIEDRIREPLDLAQLPSGLAGYYAEYWGDWRAGRNERGLGRVMWNRLYAPLLAGLAAAQDSVSLELLLAWLGLEDKCDEAEYLLSEAWRAFITEDKADKNTVRYRLYHASLRDFLTGKVDESDRLDLAHPKLIEQLTERTIKVHKQIVDYYCQQCNGNWVKLVEDDYARRYLCSHLAGAEQFEMMFALVTESDTWAKVREAKEESYAGYLTDLQLAWQRAESEDGWNISQQIRCAFIQSSIVSLAGNISPDLLTQLLEAGMWSAGKVLAYISQMPYESHRAEALTGIAHLLPAGLKVEALRIASTIGSEWDRGKALTALTPYLSTKLKSEVFQSMRTMQDEEARIKALAGLLAHLPEQIRQQAMDEALQTAPQIMNENSRTYVLSELAEHLPPELQPRLLDLASLLGDQRSRASVLAEIAIRLSDELRMEALGEALQALQAIDYYYVSPSTLENLKAYLSPEVKEKIIRKELQEIRQYLDNRGDWITPDSEYRWARVLSTLGDSIPKELRSEVLQIALEFKDRNSQTEVLQLLTPYLTPDLQDKALNELTYSFNFNPQAYVAVAKSLQPDAKLEALLTAIYLNFKDPDAKAFVGLLECLPVELYSEMLSGILVTTNASWRTYALRGFVELLASEKRIEVVREGLAAARMIKNDYDRDIALTKWIAVLPGEQKTQVLRERLQKTQAIKDGPACAFFLGQLAMQLTSELRAEAQCEALDLTRSVENAMERAELLTMLVKDLPDKLKAEAVIEALQAARTIRYSEDRFSALLRLAPYLPEHIQAEAMSETLDSALWIDDDPEHIHLYAYALYDIAEYLPSNLKTRAFNAARDIWSPYWRAVALCGLARHFPQELQSEALQAARELNSGGGRAYALYDIMTDLPADVRDHIANEVLQATLSIYENNARADLLSKVVVFLKVDRRADVIREALVTARVSGKQSVILEVISHLLPYMPADVKSEAVHEAALAIKAIEDYEAKTLVRKGLEDKLPTELRAELLAKAFSGATHIVSEKRLLMKIVLSYQAIGFFDLDNNFWCQNLRRMTSDDRKTLLVYLAALGPVIAHLGGTDVVKKVFCAARDVTQWWP